MAKRIAEYEASRLLRLKRSRTKSEVVGYIQGAWEAPDFNANPGVDLRQLREDLGLLQKEAADLVGVGIRTYTSWELGARRPPPAQCLLLKLLRRLASGALDE